MLGVSSSYELLRNLGSFQQAAQLLAGAAPAPAPFATTALPDFFSSDLNLIDLGSAGQELLALNASVDDSTRLRNTISTAGDAIGVIGGLLGNIQAVLSASTNTADPLSNDTVSEQARIDAAVSTIDTIAASTQFGGQNLLDGSFSLAGPGAGLSLPSFRSNTLGAADTNSPALDSLLTGGANSLSSGNLSAATKIVTAALSQVQSSQQSLASYSAAELGPDLASRQSALGGLDGSIADQLFVTAAQLLLSPATAPGATANSTPQDVLALIRVP